MKKIYLYGNWKMNKGLTETSRYLDELTESVEHTDNLKTMLAEDRLEIVIFPSFVSLASAAGSVLETGLDGENIHVGSQNLYYEEKGAFTGEVSWSMLKDIECGYSLIGHSERRHIFGESDILIGKKVNAALANGIIPVLCYGETLEERENGETERVVERQIGSVMEELGPGAPTEKIIFAYEPVWAIGTGRSAKPEDAEKVCMYTRKYIASILGEEIAEKAPILYGGSVKASNSELLLEQENIDGVLVGGASLDPVSFLDIVKPFM